MPNFTFLHAADLHLDSPLRGLDPEAPRERIRDATRQALVRLVDTALERRVGFVLLAGDLYDGAQKDWRCGQFLVQQLTRLTRDGIEIVAIRGNHDAESLLSAKLAVPGMMGSAAAETRLLKALPVAVHGQSFATKAVRDNLAEAYPRAVPERFNIGLLHTACGLGGHENYAPCSIEDLTRHGYDYWALGHVHARAVLSQDPWIVFPGVLQGRHINEEGDKGATLVTVEGGRVKSAEHLSLDVLRWARLEVNLFGAPSIEAMLDRVRMALNEVVMLSDGRMLALRLHLFGACPIHAELVQSPEATLQNIRAAAQETASQDELWIEDVRIETTSPGIENLREQPGVIGALITALERPATIDPGLMEFIKDQMKRTGELLDPSHPLHALMRGEVPAALEAQARALVIGELAK